MVFGSLRSGIRNFMIITDSNNNVYFGGNQSWFPYRFLKNSGCGVIAAAELLLKLRGIETIDKLEYMEFATELWKHFLPVIPGFGMNGLALAAGLNRYFWKNKMPYRAFWCASDRKMVRRIHQMLKEDMPVILSIGPNFPMFWRGEKLTFYRKVNDTFMAAVKTKAHFVTVTGWEGRMIQISSWGKEYYIDYGEYRDYVKKHSCPLVSNIVYVKKIKKE